MHPFRFEIVADAHKRCPQNTYTWESPWYYKIIQGIATENTLFLIMEHVNGEDMQMMYRTTALPAVRPEENSSSWYSLCWTASQKGSVHRDLKPAKVPCLEAVNIDMTDFGLRNEFTSYKRSTFCDSPSYFIPKFFLGSNQPWSSGCGVDGWSLGVVLCTMFTGDLSFMGEDLWELLQWTLY